MFHFQTGSLFSRNSGTPRTEPEREPEARVLAVWGSPGSGKTTVSAMLAKHLADQHENVLLLLCDATAPMLPCICPPAELEGEFSLGSVLAATHITPNLIRHNCVTHKRIRYLSVLGMRKGENVFTYPPYTAELAAELIAGLREVAPFVIVDCGTAIAHDILSAVALMEADAVLRLVNCDLKSVSFLSSQLPLLKDGKWDAEKQYKAASNIKASQASENMEQILGNVTCKIPHSDELENQMLAGDLFHDLSLKESRGFRKEIQKISKEVFGC
jgi:MinD superfamily P-loop ATPase